MNSSIWTRIFLTGDIWLNTIQFGNYWIQKNSASAKVNLASGIMSTFGSPLIFPSNNFKIEHQLVLLHNYTPFYSCIYLFTFSIHPRAYWVSVKLICKLLQNTLFMPEVSKCLFLFTAFSLFQFEIQVL